jgi:hypothetical protein
MRCEGGFGVRLPWTVRNTGAPAVKRRLRQRRER